MYAVTAFILSKGNIIGEDRGDERRDPAKGEMPNSDGFIPDPRPDVHDYE